MRARFTSPALPLNPLLRVLALAGMLVVLIGLLTVGLVVGAAALAVAVLMLAIRRWRAGRASRPADPSIIEGEFTVIAPRPHAGLPRSPEINAVRSPDAAT